MPASPAQRANAGRLTLAEVVDAAEELVAAEGFDGLSMRKLARACGVGAMTLYGYVPTKEDLLAAVGDRLLSDLELPAPTDGDWAYRVAAVFHALRRAFLVHPELVSILAGRGAEGLAAYRGSELVFGALREAGLDDAQIITAFHCLTSFTVGACQREIGLTGRSASGLSPRTGMTELPGDQLRHVVELAGRLAIRDFDADFSAGLDLLITGVRGWVEGA